MKHFIVNIIAKVPPEKLETVTPAHREHLQKYYDQGILLISGPKIPRTGGLLVGRAESLEVIQELIDRDPYNLNGLADYEIMEFNPLKHQPFLKEWIA